MTKLKISKTDLYDRNYANMIQTMEQDDGGRPVDLNSILAAIIHKMITAEREAVDDPNREN